MLALVKHVPLGLVRLLYLLYQFTSCFASASASKARTFSTSTLALPVYWLLKALAVPAGARAKRGASY